MRTHRTIEQWRELIARQKRSGLSVAAFCRREDVASSAFYRWQRRFREEPGQFAEVRMARPNAMQSATGIAGPGMEASPSAPGDGLELLLASGHRIAVRPGFDRATLRAVLDVLQVAETGIVTGLEGDA